MAGRVFEQIFRLEGAKGRAAHLHGGGTEVELFEFTHPRPQTADPKRPVNAHGITHFCIEVADLRGLHLRMSEAGVDFSLSADRFRHLRSHILS
ncbi:VOC family protein [Novosphingobium colocasiae]